MSHRTRCSGRSAAQTTRNTKNSSGTPTTNMTAASHHHRPRTSVRGHRTEPRKTRPPPHNARISIFGNCWCESASSWSVLSGVTVHAHNATSTSPRSSIGECWILALGCVPFPRGTWLPHGFRYECSNRNLDSKTQTKPAAYLSSCNVRDSWASGTVFELARRSPEPQPTRSPRYDREKRSRTRSLTNRGNRFVACEFMGVSYLSGTGVHLVTSRSCPRRWTDRL